MSLRILIKGMSICELGVLHLPTSEIRVGLAVRNRHKQTAIISWLQVLRSLLKRKKMLVMSLVRKVEG